MEVDGEDFKAILQHARLSLLRIKLLDDKWKWVCSSCGASSRGGIWGRSMNHAPKCVIHVMERYTCLPI